MPYIRYADYALKINNIGSFLFVCFLFVHFFNVGRNTLEEMGEKKTEVMLKRNHEEFSLWLRIFMWDILDSFLPGAQLRKSTAMKRP